MMLKASPARSMQVETTTASSGLTLREAIVCSAMMVCAATTTGSMPSCGRPACEPLPVISIVNLSHAASIGPGAQRELAELVGGRGVHAVDLLDAEALDQAVLAAWRGCR